MRSHDSLKRQEKCFDTCADYGAAFSQDAFDPVGMPSRTGSRGKGVQAESLPFRTAKVEGVACLRFLTVSS